MDFRAEYQKWCSDPYFDEATKEKYIPYIIESTYGLDRAVLALLFEGLHEEKISDTDSRIVFNIKPELAPVKVNILPLIKKRHAEKATELYGYLESNINTWNSLTFDENINGVIDQKDKINVNIERPGYAAIERHNILGECRTIEDLENYRNDLFNLRQ